MAKDGRRRNVWFRVVIYTRSSTAPELYEPIERAFEALVIRPDSNQLPSNKLARSFIPAYGHFRCSRCMRSGF